MTTQLGIHIEKDVLRAVVSRRGSVVMTAAAPRDPAKSVGTQLDHLLGRVSGSTWIKPTVVVALGPDAACSKRITGLPPIADRHALEHIVRDGAGRFFIGDPDARIVIARADTHGVLAVALDRATVLDVTAACQRAGIRRCLIVAAATVATRVPASVSLGADIDPQFGTAFAATLTVQSIPALVALGDRAPGTPKWRARLVMIAAGVAASFLLAAPAIASRRAAGAATQELQRIAPAYRAASTVTRQAGEIALTLDRIERFHAVGRSPTVMLSVITSVLPKDAALVAFVMDSIGGSAIVVSPAVLTSLTALDTVRLISSAKLSGPITRERLGDRELERATVLLKWATAP